MYESTKVLILFIKEYSGSVGLPIPDVEIRIVDERDNNLPQDEMGEILVKGPNVMKKT